MIARIKKLKINTLKKNTMLIFSILVFSPYCIADEKGTEPPQEMVDACKEMQIGDKCSYNDESSKKISGSCIKDGRVVICYPEEPKKQEHH